MKNKQSWLFVMIPGGIITVLGLWATFTNDIMFSAMGNIFVILGLTSLLYILAIKYSEWIENNKGWIKPVSITVFILVSFMWALLSYNNVDNVFITTIISAILSTMVSFFLAAFSEEIRNEIS